jgi:mannose-6-phosphate isomerase-like protein (cupin superfamily)
LQIIGGIKMKFSISEIKAKLPLPANDQWPDGVWDLSVFQKNNVSLSFFSPKNIDYQTSHDQDELYIVQKGKGILIISQKKFEFFTGDVLFVRAGEDHRFISFSHDLALWVIFFGPKLKRDL